MQLRDKISGLRLFWLLLLVVLFFVTHVPRLGTDEINPDAVNWHQRSEQYIDAIKSKDFARTYQHYHPGVTLMLITGTPVEILKRLSEPRVLYDRFSYEAFHFVAKYSLVVVELLLTLTVIYGLSKVLDFKSSYLTGLLLTLDPFFLGNSRLLHMDALLSLLMINSLLYFYLGIQERSLTLSSLSAFLFGFSFWTKNVSLVGIFYASLVILFLLILKKINLTRAFSLLSLLVLGFFLAGFLILPALWVNPQRVFTKMYKGSKTVVDEGHEEKFFGQIVIDPGPWYYPIVFAYKLSPQVFVAFLVGFGVFFYSLVSKAYKLRPDFRVSSLAKILERDLLLLLYLLGFAAAYFTAIEISKKKIDRYTLPIFPVIYVFSSYYLFKFLERFRSVRLKGFVMAALALLALWPLVSYFPYYFIYNSPLFGGNRMAERIIGQKSFGVGVFEVRDFIRENYGFVNVGFVDRKPIATIYPSSMVFDVRRYGPGSYNVLVLDSDEIQPNKTKGKFVYDKSIRIAGVNFWNFYVKVDQKAE